MTLFLLLLAAHFVGDFYLQPAKWVTCRHANGIQSPALFLHAGVHSILAIITLWLAGAGLFHGLAAAGVITATHLLIDWAKAGKHSPLAFVVDQCAHIVVIVFVSLSFQTESIWQLLQSYKNSITHEHLLYLVGYLIIFRPASILIAQLLSQHTAQLKAADNESLGKAGRYIGYVERLLALSFILVDEYTGLGFLVATKTVFRVGDLSRQKDMRLTEYMMLGTLMSFASALVVGWLIISINK